MFWAEALCRGCRELGVHNELLHSVFGQTVSAAVQVDACAAIIDDAHELRRGAAEEAVTREAERAQRQLQDARMAELQDWNSNMKELHAQSIKTVKKILAAEEACESSYSCQHCLDVMKEPLVLAPCGHSFCRACFNKVNAQKKAPVDRVGDSRAFCPECKAFSVSCAVPSTALDLLTGRFAFRSQALKELAHVLERSVALHHAAV